MTPEAFNAAQNGKLWHVAQLPAPLQKAWKLGPSNFAAAVQGIQAAIGMSPDGKLGPLTLKRLGPAAEPSEVCHGVDVSGHQNRDKFDFAALRKSPPAFAFVKVTQEGFSSNADAQWQNDEFRAAGSHVGYYHFADVSESAEKQCDLACARAAKVAGGKPTLPLALDLEWLDDHNALPKSAFRAFLVAWLRRYIDNTGRRGLLYTGPSFWSGHVGEGLALACDLWTVDYSHPEAAPKLPTGFTSWTFRQWTGEGKVPWYSGKMDRNFFNGDAKALAEMVE